MLILVLGETTSGIFGLDRWPVFLAVLTKTSRQLVFRGGQILATGGGDTFGACNRPVGVHVDPNDSIHLL